MLTMNLDRRAAIRGASAGLGLFAANADARVCEPADTLNEARTIDAFLAAYRARDAAAMFELLADDLYFEDPTFHLLARNKEEMRPFVEPLTKTYQSVRITPFNRIHASPWIASQQRIAATVLKNDGQRRDLEVQGLSLFQVRSGKIAKWYDYYDVLSFKQQTA